MKFLYTNDNPALVGLAKSLLENAGLEVSIKNEFSAAGMAPPYNINQELWLLNDADYDQASEIIEAMDESAPRTGWEDDAQAVKD